MSVLLPKLPVIQIKIWDTEGTFDVWKVNCNSFCCWEVKPVGVRPMSDSGKCQLDVSLSDIQRGNASDMENVMPLWCIISFPEVEEDAHHAKVWQTERLRWNVYVKTHILRKKDYLPLLGTKPNGHWPSFLIISSRSQQERLASNVGEYKDVYCILRTGKTLANFHAAGM